MSAPRWSKGEFYGSKLELLFAVVLGCGLPHFCTRAVGGNHRHRTAIHPDVFADQGRGEQDLIIQIFRNPVAIGAKHRVDSLASLRQAAHHLLAKLIGLLLGLNNFMLRFS